MLREPDRSSCPQKISGFTLIELLVVMAIIALLAAIIFPAFSAIRENGRTSSSISNLHDISVKVAQFELDNHRAPEVLFGYVYYGDNGGYAGGTAGPVAMDKALAVAEANFNPTATNPMPDADPKNWFPGLYPTYIKDSTEFMDGDNPISDLRMVTDSKYPQVDIQSANVNVLCPSRDTACLTTTPIGTLVAANHTYKDPITSAIKPLASGLYLADAYDLSPAISPNPSSSGSNRISEPGDGGGYQVVPRYQYAWTSIYNPSISTSPDLNCPSTRGTTPTPGQQEDLCTYAPPPGPAVPASQDILVKNAYLNQIHWKAPPSDSYVTCTTYHVPQSGKILVLNEGGSVKRMTPSDFVGMPSNSTDPVDISPDANGVSKAKFWKNTP